MPEPEELKQWKLDRIRRAGTHIMGRVTYEEMAAFWPTSTDDYAAPMNEVPKVVFSKTLKTQRGWSPRSQAETSQTRSPLCAASPVEKSSPGAALGLLRHCPGRDSSTNTRS
jgi:dihydrofolate reductase